MNYISQFARNARRRVFVKGIDDLWETDLVEMTQYFRENKGNRYLLTVIDVFSKYGWAIPIKSKKSDDVASAMLSILKQGRVPQNLHTDNGSEFYNSKFKNIMKQYNINHYSTFSTMKASVVERFNRTLKNLMWVEFSLRGKHRWIDILNELLKKYNESKHRTIKMKPIDVTKEKEKILLNTVHNNIKIAGRAKYKTGEYVRISKYKSLFEKDILKIGQQKYSE